MTHNIFFLCGGAYFVLRFSSFVFHYSRWLPYHGKNILNWSRPLCFGKALNHGFSEIGRNLNSVSGGHYASEVDGLGFYQVALKLARQTNRSFIGLAYQGKKDIVFRFIIEYSSLRDFYRPLGSK